MIAGASTDPGYRLKRWTLEEYHRFVELGVIAPEARVEFVEGEIVEKMGQNFPHITAIGALAEALRTAFGASHHVREGRPVLVEQSEPEPDLSVLSGGPRDYQRRHPRPSEIALLVEVSDSTLPYDLGRKAALYARGGISEYWVVDLNARRLLVHRSPRPDGSWEEIAAHAPGGTIRPLNAVGELAVSDLLPPEEPANA